MNANYCSELFIATINFQLSLLRFIETVVIQG